MRIAAIPLLIMGCVWVWWWQYSEAKAWAAFTAAHQCKVTAKESAGPWPVREAWRCRDGKVYWR